MTESLRKCKQLNLRELRVTVKKKHLRGYYKLEKTDLIVLLSEQST